MRNAQTRVNWGPFNPYYMPMVGQNPNYPAHAYNSQLPGLPGGVQNDPNSRYQVKTLTNTTTTTITTTKALTAAKIEKDKVKEKDKIDFDVEF